MFTEQDFVIKHYFDIDFQNQRAMREYTKKPENQSRTLDSNPKASRQAPIDVILQRYKGRNIQRYSEGESEELIQGKFEFNTQTEQQPVPREGKPNNTGLPDNLKTGIENLSGYSMNDVKVHYNSEKRAQLNALAYAQGTDIHVALGQEKHLPHEAWHIVQQKRGRVQPTAQLQGVDVNGNERLEKEADKYGKLTNSTGKNNVIQRQVCLLKKAFTDDFVENTSIDYSYKRAGGPIETFPTSNFSLMPAQSKLYFVAHGAPGVAGEYTGEQIADRLTDPIVGLKNQISEIIFTSCNVGTDKTSTDDSVVDKVYAAVKPKSPNVIVKGATGASIKSHATGNDFMVIDPSKELAGDNLTSKVIEDSLTTLNKYIQLMQKKFSGKRWTNLNNYEKASILYNLDIVNDWPKIISQEDLKKSAYYLQKRDEDKFIKSIKLNPKAITSSLQIILATTPAPAPVLDIAKVEAIISSTTATEINTLVLSILSTLPMEFKTNPVSKSEFIAKLTESFLKKIQDNIRRVGIAKSNI